MKLNFRPYLQLELLRRTVLGLALAWAAFATIMVVRTKPEFVLIGLDANGTRLIVRAQLVLNL